MQQALNESDADHLSPTERLYAL